MRNRLRSGKLEHKKPSSENHEQSPGLIFAPLKALIPFQREMGAPPCANKGKQTNGARLFRKNLFNCELPDKFNAFRSPCSSVVRRKVRIVLRYRNWATRVGICIAFSAVMQGPVCYPNHGGQSDVMIKKLAPLHQGQCVLEIFRALKAAMNNC